ncbi:multidrug resistance protein [Aspergillus terreus]|nr:multidrug resistance protein [Aspergillus terreus]
MPTQEDIVLEAIQKTPVSMQTEASLSEAERQIIDRQLQPHVSKVGLSGLYRFASRWDMGIAIGSALAAIVGGAALPFFTKLIIGQLASTLRDVSTGTSTIDQFNDQLATNVVYFIYLAIVVFVTLSLSTIGFTYTGDHVVQKIRVQYLQAVLRQNIAFFDTLGAGEITNRIITDTNQVQDGISEKAAGLVSAVASFIAAFVIAYAKYWKLALVCTATLVAMVLTMGGGAISSMVFNKKALGVQGTASSLAEDILDSIRTVIAFGAQNTLAKKYESHLKGAQNPGIKSQVMIALMIGGLVAVNQFNSGLGFWMGSRFLVNGESHIKTGDIVTIIMAIALGSYSLGNVAPNVQSVSAAVAAASKLYAMIDRQSPLDALSDEGKKLTAVRGSLNFQHIRHIYPSRPEVTVLHDLSIYIPAGKTTAFVGPSGSGKSTLIGLIERFYEPVGGTISLDGHNIVHLNLRWLRQQIALVSQEPKLFAATIFENIKFGLVGSEYENETEAQIAKRVEEAARMANAHDFIMALPNGYDTSVGGFSLSGGQRQRIAIARAIVKNPKILLLDEATSALDAKSERIVQAALDQASRGRTTIVIAHRLSTIKEADNIVVFADGRIVEQGSHRDLMGLGGVYHNMVKSQQVQARLSTLMGQRASVVDHDSPDDDLHDQDEYSDSGSEIGLKTGRMKRRKSRMSMLLALHPAEEKKQASLGTLMKFIFSFNRPEWKLMAVAFFICALAGGVQPTQNAIYAKAITTLSLPPSQYHKLRQDANFWCLMFLMLGFTTLLLFYLQGIALAYCSEKLLYRARSQAFRVLLHKETSFFDQEEHTTGSLVAMLSTEAKQMAEVSGNTLGTLLMVSVNLVASIVVAIAMGWKLGLVCVSTVPVLLLAGFLRFWVLGELQRRSKRAYQTSASSACEAAAAIRTVVSMTMEGVLLERYQTQLQQQLRGDLIFLVKSSMLYASSQALPYLCMALGFWYGGNLLGRGEYSLFQLYICFTEIIFGVQAAGSIFSKAPSMSSSKHAAASFQDLFGPAPIMSHKRDGLPVPSIEGCVEFRDVSFAYPTRIQQRVLRHFDLTIKPGQYVAIVGASGSGKSTIVALLQRFYNAVAGEICVDGRNIASLDTEDYRRHLALVGQEPSLFQGTIRENILLGCTHADPDASEEALLEACKAANIIDFIMSLPQGFDTIVGSKGGMLSGGQKQRIAIARALIRNPKILLLDEATSALDSESEKVVQDALDAAAHGRTTIAVAHRLSTIQRADMICVLDQGEMVECGTHKELIQKRGQYYELVKLQTLG